MVTVGIKDLWRSGFGKIVVKRMIFFDESVDRCKYEKHQTVNDEHEVNCDLEGNDVKTISHPINIQNIIKVS